MSETQSIEYKSSWRDEYLKWICGFANAQGGALYIGKDDDGKIVGVDNAKKLMENIPNKIRDILGIVADVNLHETESLLNAVVHKDYASGIPVQISVYPDHIVFWNPGQLAKPLTVETLLQKHPSIPYNPDIANAFFRSGDIEAWGRGYRKIVKSVSDNKQLPPAIEDIGGLMITYYTDVLTQLAAQSLEERLIAIIEYVIKNGSIDNSQVRQLLNVSKPTATRLLKQTEEWLIIQGVTGKGTFYVIKWNINGLTKGSQRAHKID